MFDFAHLSPMTVKIVANERAVHNILFDTNRLNLYEARCIGRLKPS